MPHQPSTIGLDDLLGRVAQGEQLAARDAQRLADAPLPLLAKLVELRTRAAPYSSWAIDPVVHLPLTDRVVSDDLEGAISRAMQTIGTAAGQLASLIEQDQRVQEFGDCVGILHVVLDGPEDSFWTIARSVTDDFERHAAQAGISVVLREWRKRNRKAARAAQAADTMRAIALARLTSAEHTEIRAPVGQLGIKAAHVALSFGANHLGEVAVNIETAAALQLPTLAELAEALRYDMPTPV